MFCSGYFYKGKAEADSFRYVLKKVRSLLLPLYLWNLVYAAIVTISACKGFTIGVGVTWQKLLLLPLTNGHQFIYNLGGWFVAPLFMIEVCNVFFRIPFSKIRNVRLKESLLFAIYLCAGILGVYLASRGLNTNGWLVLARMLYFLPFYGLGVFYKAVLESVDTARSSVYFLALFAADAVLLLLCKKTPGYFSAWCNDFVDGPVVPFIAGFLGIAFWLRIARILEPVIGRSRAVNLIADNTYSIMIHQFLGFMAVKTVFALISGSTGYFADFDWVRYKSDIWYYYLPGGITQAGILYLFAGIALPVAIQLLLNRTKQRISRFRIR